MSTTVEIANETVERAISPDIASDRCCSNCKTKDPDIEWAEFDGKALCLDCYDELVSECGHCHMSFWRDVMTCVYESLYCDECLNEYFRYCSGCEVYVDRDRACYSEIHDCDYCESCFSNYVTYCVSCDGQIDPERCRVNDAGETFCEDCWEHRDEASEEAESHEFSGSVFVKCPSRRKYGLEIEAILEDGSHLAPGNLRYWQQVEDGSLGNHGREFVSPILQGDEGFDAITKFTDVLKDRGYFVNRQCGLHIHIDGRDLECAHVKNLLKITRYFEPIIYAMLPRSRYDGTYSVPLEKFPKSRFRNSGLDETSLKKLWYGKKRGETVNLKNKYHHSRYYGLNIHSWFFRRSLEFRYHSGTLNPKKITNFIILCQALVDRARSSPKFKSQDPPDFKSHFERFVSFLEIPPGVILYIRERILKFHPEKFEEPVSFAT